MRGAILYCKDGISLYTTKVRTDETAAHSTVSDPIKKGFGLFGKETLDADELKKYLEYLRIKLG